MSGRFNMDDYVDVAERVREFYAKYPEGSLKTGSPPQFVEVGGKAFVVYHAQAFRTYDDICPADGWAWEPVPGPTQFTKDSELQNAETAAWGRAIVACGFETKKIASRQEVQNRSAGGPSRDTETSESGPAAGAQAAAGREASAPPAESLTAKAQAAQAARDAKPATKAAIAQVDALIAKAAVARGKTEDEARAAIVHDYGPLDKLTAVKAEELVGKLERWAAA